jgi:tRNA 2-thiouridine synthesizing protein D
MARVLAESGAELAAVYFREEGVYHAAAGRSADAGTPCLTSAWRSLSLEWSVPLVLCLSAAQRRLEADAAEGFREAGLGEMVELMASCDRVVAF